MPALLLALLLTLPHGRGGRITHPVPKATLSAFGDSIAAGACGSPLDYQISLLLPAGYVHKSNAHAGETADQIAKRVLSEAATACLGEPCGTYVLEGGVNTLKSTGFDLTPDADVAAYALNGDDASVLGMMDAVDNLRTAQPYSAVILVGVLPYAGCDALTCPSLVRPGNRAALYNAALLAACAARPWLKCVSPYADFEDPDAPDYLKPAIACTDGIHLLTAGHAQLAAAVHAARRWR